jgi:hypothetical protein
MNTKKVIISLFVISSCISVVFADLNILIMDDYKNIDGGKFNVHVADLQKTLNELGYTIKEDKNGDPVPPSGIIDLETTAAIKDFQKENELKVTGKINEETIATLNQLVQFVNDNSQGGDNDNSLNTSTSMQGEVMTPWWERFVSYIKSWF